MTEYESEFEPEISSASNDELLAELQRRGLAAPEETPAPTENPTPKAPGADRAREALGKAAQATSKEELYGALAEGGLLAGAPRAEASRHVVSPERAEQVKAARAKADAATSKADFYAALAEGGAVAR